jgi:hypothetical protein
VTATETAPNRLTEVDGIRSLPDVEEVRSEQPEQRASSAPSPRQSHVVLRRVEPWSVFKLSLLFYLCLSLALLVAGVVLWVGASAAGVVGNIESFFQEAGFENFEFSAGQLLRGFTVGSLILVLAGTVANMLLASLFNLMSDVVGGVRVTLAEDLHAKR